MRGWLADTGRAAGHVFAGVAVAGLTVIAVMILFISWIWSFAALVVYQADNAILDVLYAAVLVGNPWLLWYVLDRLGDLQRLRFRLILDVAIPTPPLVTLRDLVRLRNPFVPWRLPSTYRQFVYHVCGAVINGLVLFCTLSWLPAMLGAFPAWLSGAAMPLVLATPVAVRGAARLDRAAGRALLGPTRAQELTHRLDALARSRAEVVEATDAERRRIERDLHDGPQQRLVSLAMNLGMARENLDDVAPPVRAAIESAHDEALAALTELRQFVRGLHPAVLNDRGLDAALSGVAARAPLPVRLTVDVPARCSPSVEAIAYFVVSEALTNVAKHAQATRADVAVERVGDQLFVSVTDDGRGGARIEEERADGGPDGGTGLRGLSRRAAALDGTLAIQSPHGGPTAITVVLPCES